MGVTGKSFQRAAPRPISMTNTTSERILRPTRGLVSLNFEELWRFRELLGLLAWRDILIRYKQTYLGIAWAVLQPVLTMVVFTFIFGRLAKFESWGAPYAILTLAALLPWQFFSNALSESSNSLVASSRIISKVYFPRLIIPISAVFSGLLDAVIATVILLVLLPFYGIAIRLQLLLLPLFFLAAFLPAFAGGVWLSALNVKYRDVRYIVPFIVRLGMYVTPVGFLWQTVLPDKWRLLFHINPLVGAIDGFRWCVLGDKFAPWWPGFWLSIGITLAVLFAGLVYFRQTEKSFADHI
jgi:lipopolysaccharide transport system permease protein